MLRLNLSMACLIGIAACGNGFGQTGGHRFPREEASLTIVTIALHAAGNFLTGYLQEEQNETEEKQEVEEVATRIVDEDVIEMEEVAARLMDPTYNVSEREAAAQQAKEFVERKTAQTWGKWLLECLANKIRVQTNADDALLQIRAMALLVKQCPALLQSALSIWTALMEAAQSNEVRNYVAEELVKTLNAILSEEKYYLEIQKDIRKAFRLLMKRANETDNNDLRATVLKLTEWIYEIPSDRGRGQWVVLLHDLAQQAETLEDMQALIWIMCKHSRKAPRATIQVLHSLLDSFNDAQPKYSVLQGLVLILSSREIGWDRRIEILQIIAQQATQWRSNRWLEDELRDLQHIIERWMIATINSLGEGTLARQDIAPETIKRILETLVREAPYCALHAKTMIYQVFYGKEPAQALQAARADLIERCRNHDYCAIDAAIIAERMGMNLLITDNKEIFLAENI